MKLPWISALLGTTLAAQVALAADARPARPEMRPHVPQYSLNSMVWDFPSGLRVILQEDHSHPIVSVFTIVDHGFQDEPEGKEELAHFVEHVWFRSVHEPWPPIMEVITGHTDIFNATTRNDWTDYRTTMSSFYLEKLIKMEGERLAHPYRGVTKEQIDVEREVIRNEWRRRNEQDKAFLLDYANRYIYPKDHPYSRSSSHESLTNIKLEDLQWYMDTFYKPSETTITIVGDFDPTEVQSYIFKHFEPQLLHPDLTEKDCFVYPRPDVTNPDVNNPEHVYHGCYDPQAKGELLRLVDINQRKPRITQDRPPVPPLGNPELGVEKGPVDHRTAIVGWSLPAGFRDDQWEMVILGNLLSSTVNQGLRQLYPEKEYGDRIGEETYCFAHPLVLNTTVMCQIQVVDPKLDPAVLAEKALDQLAVLWNPDYIVSFNRDFERSRHEVLSDVLLSLDNVASVFGGRSEEIGVFAHYTGKTNYHSEAMNQIMNVDGAQIIKLGVEHLKRQRAAKLIVEPLGAADMDTRSANSNYAGASAEDALVDEKNVQLVDDEVIADLYTTIDTSKLVDTTLDNGLRVVIMKHGEGPIVQASMVFGGGSSSAPKGLHSFVSRFTQAQGFDPLEIAGSTNYPYYPGYANIVPPSSRPMAVQEVWPNSWRMDFRAPSGNLDGALWKMRGELESIRPDLDAKTTWVRGWEDALKRNWGSAGWHSSVAFNDHLYPNHLARRATSWEDVQAWKSWGGAQISSYLTRYVQPKNAALVIVGNIDPNEALEIAKAQFGGWTAKTDAGWAEPLVLPEMPTAPERILIYDDPKRTQTDIRMACRLNYDGEQDDPAVDVLSSILGDQTFATIRVKEGLAYSPGASASVSADGAATLTFYSLTVNAGVGRVTEFFHDAVDRIAKGEASAAEVNGHKLKLANAGGIGAQSIDQMLGYLAYPVRNQKDWSVLTDAGKHIASVSPDTLDDLVKDCLPHAVTTMYGPKDVITPQLDAKGYKYEVIDWKAQGDELLWKYDPKAAKKKQKAEKKKAAAEGESGS